MAQAARPFSSEALLRNTIALPLPGLQPRLPAADLPGAPALFFYAFDIGPGARVDFDQLAFFEKSGDLEHISGF